MRAILPMHLGGSGSPSHHPRWRSWAQGQPQKITYAELFDGITKVLTRAIEDAGEGLRLAGAISSATSAAFRSPTGTGCSESSRLSTQTASAKRAE